MPRKKPAPLTPERSILRWAITAPLTAVELCQLQLTDIVETRKLAALEADRAARFEPAKLLGEANTGGIGQVPPRRPHRRTREVTPETPAPPAPPVVPTPGAE